MSKLVVKVALTGGPCGGKTEGQDVVAVALEALGWKVIKVYEAATEEINSGVPIGSISTKEFQNGIMMAQISKENIADYYASCFPNEKILILCDRGLIDGWAYCNSDEEFDDILSKNHIDKADAYQRYDAVFQMVTAADGAEEFYSCDNNEARGEKLEEARELDYRLRSLWSKHPYFMIFDNKDVTYEQKLQHLVNEIIKFLDNKAEEHEAVGGYDFFTATIQE